MTLPWWYRRRTAPVVDAKEHVLAVRVYDRYENMAAAKAVVR